MRGIFGAMARPIETKTTDISALTWTALFGQPSSKAGVAVNVDTALRVSTVLACARVLAEGVAQLPLKVFRLGADDSRTPATDNPVYRLIYRRPNQWQTSFEWREMMMYHAVLTGNAYTWIGRTRNGIKELLPLIPEKVTVHQISGVEPAYRVADASGGQIEIPARDMLHLRGPSWNGYAGMDAVRLAREAIGLAIATEENHSRLFSNGAQPGGVLSVDGKLNDKSRDRIRAKIAERIEGIANRYSTLVLDQAAKWQSMSMTGVDSQHLETRRFQIEEVCRAFRVFPQMVMHSDKTSTFASAESFFLAHVTHSLLPWISRWEHTIEHRLLADDPDLIAKFSVAALMRGTPTERATFYEKALGGARGETAYMTRNEVRRLEELDPIEGGDKLPLPAPMPTRAPAPGLPADTGPISPTDAGQGN